MGVTLEEHKVRAAVVGRQWSADHPQIEDSVVSRLKRVGRRR
jgi:hypothetical protein